VTRLLLVTHQGIGEALLEVARTIVGGKLDVAAFAVEPDADAAAVEGELARWLEAHRVQAPLLLLTDLPGATPHNLAVRVAPPSVPVVAGVNLAMLLRAINHADHPPDELAERAVVGGRRAILRAAAE
jgi:mannose/fructose-specific phosphotransferase system component IIA